MQTLVQLLKETAVSPDKDTSAEDIAHMHALFDDAAKMADNYLERTKHYNEIEQGRVAGLFVCELISRLPRGKQAHAMEVLNEQQERLMSIITIAAIKEKLIQQRRGK